MLRDKNLIPLSHQHQHALALCVRLERELRGGGGDLACWQEEIVHAFAHEIRYHFEAEEQVLFPAAEHYQPLAPLVKQLLAEHATLREWFRRAGRKELNQEELLQFTELLSQHVRTEERQLFEGCQQAMPPDELARLGAAMEDFFRQSGMPGTLCTLPQSEDSNI